MAFQVRFKIGLHGYLAFLMLISLLFSKTSVVNSIQTDDLDAMLSIVRARGYNLFANAIATSDLQLDLLTAPANASFTFFAPTDSSLFSLAMTQSASAYTDTLRFHGVPRRLSLNNLNRYHSEIPIPTLLRSHCVYVTRRRQESRSETIAVNGIDVVLPGLYYDRHLAVHGLGGILSVHSQFLIPVRSPPPPPLFGPSNPRSFPPQIDFGSKQKRDFAAPPADPPVVLSPVSPPISPSNSSNETVDLALNRVFLGPAPEQSQFQVVEPPAIPSVSPLASPGLPPVVSSDLTPSSMPNDNTEPPSPSIGSPVVGETALMMESEDGLSGRTTEGYEPLDWMSLGFTEGDSNDIDVEDSHPPPNAWRG